MVELERLKKELQSHENPAKIKVYQWFFKTAPGQYGHGDVFLGLSVPQQRQIAKKYVELPLADIKKLLSSKIHEHRFTGLAVLVLKYKQADEPGQKKIYQFYIDNAKKVNNWDLVDSSAEYIVGEYLFNKNKAILYKLAKSENLWEKRIAIISTFGFIKRNQFNHTFKIVEILLNDKHDLIHKAVGWMLREVGKRDLKAEEEFLEKYARVMPRTSLRYAIERMPKSRRTYYLTRKSLRDTILS